MIQLFLLPKELWRDVILCFVTTKDIARTTEAIVNRAMQAQFRKLIDGHTSLKLCALDGDNHTDQLKWCLSKNILLCNVIVTDKLSSLPMTVYARLSTLNFYYLTNVPSGDKLPCILQACSRSLRHLQVFSYPFLLSGLSSCLGLETIYLGDCTKLTADSLLESLTSCKRLRDISIDSCGRVNQRLVAAVLDRFSRLESFSFGGTESNPYNLDKILAKCKRTTSQVHRIDLLPHTIVTGAARCKLMGFAPSLRALLVDCCDNQVTDADIADLLLRNSAQLTELSLTGSAQLTGAALVTIARQLPLLQKLDVTSCRSVGDVGVTAVAKSCVHLKGLNLSRCDQVSDQAVREIWTYCTLLEELDLCGCVQVTNAGFPLATDRVSSVLRKLDVSGTSIRGAPFLHGRQIRSLRCNGCASLDSSFVRDRTGFQYIEQLFLNAVQLRPEDFLSLTTFLPRVRMVHMSCSSLTDVVLHSLVVHNPCLQCIVAISCANVTAHMVEQLQLSYKGKITFIIRP